MYTHISGCKRNPSPKSVPTDHGVVMVLSKSLAEIALLKKDLFIIYV